MLNKIIAKIHVVEMWVSMFGLVVLTVCIFIGAVGRCIGHPQAWSTDVGMMMLAWSTFLGGDVAFRNGRFANLNLLLKKFPLKMQKVIILLSYLAMLVFLLLMIYQGFILSWTTRFRSFNGVPQLSYTWVTLSLPVSCCFMVFSLISRFLKLWKSTDKEELSNM